MRVKGARNRGTSALGRTRDAWGRNPVRPGALFPVTAVAGKTPRAPTTAANLSPGPRQARPARSSASAPPRRAARRSSRVKPAGASVRVVTPAAA